MIKSRPSDFIVSEIPSIKFGRQGRYKYFLLEKKNYNTEDAIIILSKHFKIPRKKFSYAGTKDKVAITKQYCSVL